MKLPEWDPARSDGCSALALGPLILRRRFNHFVFSRWPDATPACMEHDRAYYYGGTAEMRHGADLELIDAWNKAGVPKITRDTAFRLIRTFGGPGWRTPGVSWAFGGGHFQYDDEADTGADLNREILDLRRQEKYDDATGDE